MTTLGSTAEEFLGLPGIASVARSQSPIGAVNPVYRAFADEKLLDQTVNLLDKANRIQSFMQAQKARAAGDAVMGELSGLRPDQPDYLTKRNELLARYPHATLDQTALNFLGLQEDVFQVSERQRWYTQNRADDLTDFSARADKQIEAEDRAQDRYRSHEISRNVMGLTPEARGIYESVHQNTKDPETALSEALAFEQDQETRLAMLQEGFSPEEILGLETPENKTRGFKVIDRGKAAAELGKRKQAAFSKKLLDDHINKIEDEIRDLRTDLKADIYEDIASETLAKKRLSDLQETLTKLRGIGGITAPAPNGTDGPASSPPPNPYG